MRDTENEREAETQAEEKQAPCREPDVGLDPGIPGSCPGLKAGVKPLSHPGVPGIIFLNEGGDTWVAQQLSLCLQLRA